MVANEGEGGAGARRDGSTGAVTRARVGNGAGRPRSGPTHNPADRQGEE